MYSQNSAEKYIFNYFKSKEIEYGKFLDIGAYDGITFSNTHALAQFGWSGVCVEPSPTVFTRLENNYRDRADIKLVRKAIGKQNATLNFYDNSNFVATLDKEETKRWPDEEFNIIPVKVITFARLMHEYPPPYRFISIDAEGLDYEILSQIDLDKVGCDYICVEHNGKILKECQDYIYKFGFKMEHINAENLLMFRP